MLNDFLFVSKNILKEFAINIVYEIECNLKNFSNIIAVVLPFLTFYAGRYTNLKNVIGFIFILIVLFISYFTKQFANKIGKGEIAPVPSKRFTEKSNDGEVSIEVERLQELTLYMADLEDWFESKGIMFK